jgi:hypothetical protein
VLHREATRGGAGRGARLREDVLDVVARPSFGGDHELLSDRVVGEPAREQSEDLDLALGQSRRAAMQARLVHRLVGVGGCEVPRWAGDPLWSVRADSPSHP